MTDFWNPVGGGGGGQQIRPLLGSQKGLNYYWAVNVVRHLTELLANLHHTLIIFPYIS